MANRHVHTVHVLAFLIDDRVDRHRRFTGLTIANDQLTLAAANRHHGVNGFEARLHGLVYRFTPNHARRNFFNHIGELGVNRAFAIDRLAKGVHHAANELGTNGNIQNAAGGFYNIAFGDFFIVAQNHRANRIALKV